MNNRDLEDKIAYLSMEVAVDEKLSTYAGGLGILAGDFLRSAADLNLPLVGVSLLNKGGYFNQEITYLGQQTEASETNHLENLEKLPITIKVNIGSRQVSVGAWKYLINNSLPVYFLDTDLSENQEEDRQLTDHLYGQDQLYRLQQEIILGRGGAKILEALGYKIKKFHVNEDHGILVALELLSRIKEKGPSEQRDILKQQLIFTNHTPVRMGKDIFSLKTFLTYQPDFPIYFTDLIINQKVNLTLMGVKLAGQVNGVSKKHQETLIEEFPDANIGYVTNGVHAAFWSSPEFAKLYDKYFPAWKIDNALLGQAEKISLAEIDQAHQAAKKRLLDYTFKKTGIILDKKILTLVFARRFTSYKQPLLLLSDMDRLIKIHQSQPLQIIYAGKAHPRDKDGQEMIEKVYALKEKYHQEIKIVFLENYGITLARLLTAGADLWLNNPLPPNEACGTSGMKAALNGVPQLSSPDGWWCEAYQKDKNGWLIEDSRADDLYKALEEKILPLYYQEPEEWTKIMRNAISCNAPVFNSERMVKEYCQKDYNLL